jgi:hypothetical protein
VRRKLADSTAVEPLLDASELLNGK